MAGKVFAAQQQLKRVGPHWQAKRLQHNSSSSAWDRTGRQSVCSTTAFKRVDRTGTQSVASRTRALQTQSPRSGRARQRRR